MKQKATIALILAVFLASISFLNYSATSDQALYQEWKENLGIRFTPEEQIYRMQIFKDNVAKINLHNSQQATTHKEALNKFAFLSQKQFVAQYLSTFEVPDLIIQDQQVKQSNGPAVDWVSYGAVSPVLNQGQCPASYAFSAIGAVEGVSAIFYQKQITYSVQQMVDCTQAYGNNGCASGTMEACFSFIKDKGVAQSSTYPYNGMQNSCKSAGGIFKVGNYTSVRDCTNLANALISRPISVVVDGNNFQFYNSGIFYNCGTNLSLGVLLVGMNDYSWNVKNSWGPNWGESGYIRLGRGNTCGICNYASYPNTF